MSPEYTVGTDKNGRTEIRVRLLPGEEEEKDNHRKEILTPYVANSLFRKKYGFDSVVEKLREVLPEKYAESLSRAVIDDNVGYTVTFRKDKQGIFEIREENT